MAGTLVAVRLYVSDDPARILEHIDEVQLVAQDGDWFPRTAFSFPVGDGTYYLRAFRDTAGPHDGPPDGLPTLPVDPQAPITDAIVVSGGSSSGHALVLVQAINGNNGYDGFDAQTEHESLVPEPPEMYANNQRFVGEGRLPSSKLPYGLPWPNHGVGGCQPAVDCDTPSPRTKDTTP